MATLNEFIETVADELGIDTDAIKITFEKGNLILVCTDVDEDAFDEDQSFDDEDDESGDLVGAR